MLGMASSSRGMTPSDQFLQRPVAHSPAIQWMHVICLVLRGAFGTKLAIIEDAYDTNLAIIQNSSQL